MKITHLPDWVFKIKSMNLPALSYHWTLSSCSDIRNVIEKESVVRIRGYGDINLLMHDAETIRRSNDTLFYRLVPEFHRHTHALSRYTGQQIPYESVTALRLMLPLRNDLEALSLTVRQF